jgi:signal transduction histidine kinase
VLRARLAALLAGSLLVALIGFALVVDALFLRQELARLEGVLGRELDRVTRLVERSQVGATFLAEDAGLVLQFVDREGTVQLPADAGPALPLRVEPARVRGEGQRSWLVASAPWRLPSGREVGTVRIGADLADVTGARAALGRAILLGGGGLALVVTTAALLLLGRALAPLRRLVHEADRVDPARPDLEVAPEAAARDDEVGRLARALRRSMAAIRERQQAERDALAEVAHELAAPLSVVAGRLRGLEERDASPEIRSAREAADELLYTSQDLLTLARGELERVLDLRALDLSELARTVATETLTDTVGADDPHEVLGSPERLRQALRNLLRNATQAGGDPAEVRLEVRREGDEVVAGVVDRGPGLPAATERLFERHVSDRPGGSGLGLSVARAIAEAHDGALRAENRPGGGARFELRLPALDARLEEDERESDG